MPVSSNDMIVLATLSDWLIGSFSTNEKQNQTNNTSCKPKFSCPLSMFQVISRKSDWFIACVLRKKCTANRVCSRLMIIA